VYASEFRHFPWRPEIICASKPGCARKIYHRGKNPVMSASRFVPPTGEYLNGSTSGRGSERYVDTGFPVRPKAPTSAASAEIHLVIRMRPARFGSMTSALRSQVPFLLADRERRPWPGQQEITFLVINRQATRFQGNIRAVVAKATKTVPVTLEPGASEKVKVPIHYQWYRRA